MKCKIQKRQLNHLWQRLCARALALRDYYPFWKSRNERSRAGKLLVLDPDDHGTIQARSAHDPSGLLCSWLSGKKLCEVNKQAAFAELCMRTGLSWNAVHASGQQRLGVTEDVPECCRCADIL